MHANYYLCRTGMVMKNRYTDMLFLNLSDDFQSRFHVPGPRFLLSILVAHIFQSFFRVHLIHNFVGACFQVLVYVVFCFVLLHIIVHFTS